MTTLYLDPWVFGDKETKALLMELVDSECDFFYRHKEGKVEIRNWDERYIWPEEWNRFLEPWVDRDAEKARIYGEYEERISAMLENEARPEPRIP